MIPRYELIKQITTEKMGLMIFSFFYYCKVTLFIEFSPSNVHVNLLWVKGNDTAIIIRVLHLELNHYYLMYMRLN